MENSSKLKHIIGQESKIVVRESVDVKTDDFFYSQYTQAIKIADSIIANSESAQTDKTQFDYANNIIAFIGDRGSGKTSCMLTFANLLKKKSEIKEFQINSNNNYSFYQLPPIDPSFFSADYNIIGAFIANIYREIQSLTEEKKLPNGMIQDFYNALSEAQSSFGRLNSDINKEFDDMERLEQLSCSMKLKTDIQKLTKAFLTCKNLGNGFIILCVDDIDLNTQTAVEMVEWIRKYLILPNIIILFAVKLDQLMNLKRLKLFTEYDKILKDERMSASEIDDMAERYMEKLFPLSNRVYLPDTKTLPFAEYESIKPGESTEQSGSPMALRYDTKTLRNVLVDQIFEKTRYLFYNTITSTSYIVPNNLREALHLMKMLHDMPLITGSTLKDGTNSDERQKTLSSNQNIFKEYLFHDCTFKYLNSESRGLVEELLEVADATKFNSKVLYILKNKFTNINSSINQYYRTPYPSRNRDTTAENSTDDGYLDTIPIRQIESTVYDIFDKQNMSHNISTGDVLWILNWLENMETTNEESYFLFVVRFIYSIKMYEYYNEIFGIDYKELSDEEKKGFVVYSHPLAEIKEKSPYHQLLAGSIFNKKLVPFIPESQKNNVISNGVIDWAKIKKELLSDDNIKLVEFLMLCTGGPTDSHDTYRLQSIVSHAHTFGSSTKKAKFDIYSFFYNITNIEACYKRFELLLGKDYIEKVLNSPDSLWAEFYRASINTDIFTVENRNLDSIKDLKVETVSDYMGHLEPRKNISVTLDDKVLSHLWLSWSCIRNAEVYQDFYNYLAGNRNKSKEKDLKKKLIGFFESVFGYRQATHDFISESSNRKIHYKLNFTFVGSIINLLNQCDSDSLMNYILPLNGWCEEAEDSKVDDAAINAILDSIFGKGTWKPKAKALEKINALTGLSEKQKDILKQFVELQTETNVLRKAIAETIKNILTSEDADEVETPQNNPTPDQTEEPQANNPTEPTE